MIFEKHARLEGLHAPFSASSSAWLRYNDEKALEVYNNKKAAEMGTKLHAWAKQTIDLGIKQPRSKKTLYSYVNDAIGFKMSTEVVLFYSERFFGTADAISFRNNMLRIHDLKTGKTAFKNEPIQQAAGLCYILRRIVNEDDSRIVALMEILEKTPRAIIFYNFDYEREMLLHLTCDDEYVGYEIAEWSGHTHQEVPNCERWIYLVQYTAGCEGWNCIKTDTIIFFSQNYSYKVMQQASGRIDRMNTPYRDLYYYHLKSRSGIDLAISKALAQKKKFNERKFTKWDK